jgi:hypothetical protein
MTTAEQNGPDDDYEVGYKKPPKATRFVKGQSGNRKGRPRNTRNFKTDLRSVLDEDLMLTVGGEQVKLSACRAMLVALRNKALKGDVRAIGLFVNLLERLIPETLAEEVKHAIPRDDLEIFAEAIDRHVTLRLAQTSSSPTSNDLPVKADHHD